MEKEDHYDYDDSLCCICYCKNKMQGFGCKTCKASLCVECFGKINRPKFNFEDHCEVYAYKCPICAIEDTYDFTNFDKEDLIYLIRDDLTKIFNNLILNPKQKIGNLVNKINDIEKSSEKLKQILLDKEEENKNLKATIEKQNEILKIYKQGTDNNIKNLRFICNMNKNKRIDKKLLKPFYEFISIPNDLI